MPLTGDLRDKWIHAIQEHQSTQEILAVTYVGICSLHFAPADILKNKKLRKGATPTIFLNSQNETREERDTDSDENEGNLLMIEFCHII